jgi:hypothetical protein
MKSIGRTSAPRWRGLVPPYARHRVDDRGQTDVVARLCVARGRVQGQPFVTTAIELAVESGLSMTRTDASPSLGKAVR